MSEPGEPILIEFRKLPPTEKIRLGQQLWDETTRAPLSEEAKKLLNARIGEHDANPDDVEPWEQARDEILLRL